MIIWNINALTHRLRAGTINLVDRLSYLFVFILQYALGLLVFQAIPTVYRLVFNYTKTELEAKAGHASLKLNVYQNAPDWFPFALGCIIVIGLLACWLAHCKQGVHHFIDRFICLSTPISMRILLVTLLFFGMILLFGGFYFSNQIYALQQPRKSPRAPFDPFMLIWRTVTKVTGLKIILKNLALLERAQNIFKEMNQFSYMVYLSSYWTALFSTILYFWQMQKHLRCMQPKE